MRETTDLWYLRFPDGRVLRAAGTAVVRQQLVSGRIPAGTWVRRSLDEEWRAAERYPEFADLASPANGARSAGSGIRSARSEGRDQTAPAPATIASRLDPNQLDQVGVRTLLEELLAALDSTIVSHKLFAALVAGALLGGLVGVSSLPVFSFATWPPGAGWLLVLGAVVVVSWLIGVLTRLTFTELSRLRPARWSDGWHGIVGFVCKHALLLVAAGVLLFDLTLAARWLPGWLLASAAEDGGVGWLIGAQVAAVASVLVAALAWTVWLFLLPLGPVLVIEECSLLAALARWLRLVRRHFSRLLLVEGMALSIGLVLSLPLALLAPALSIGADAPELELASRITRCVVGGMAAALPLGYLIVANVFIYLHFRYESNEAIHPRSRIGT